MLARRKYRFWTTRMRSTTLHLRGSALGLDSAFFPISSDNEIKSWKCKTLNRFSAISIKPGAPILIRYFLGAAPSNGPRHYTIPWHREAPAFRECDRNGLVQS